MKKVLFAFVLIAASAGVFAQSAGWKLDKSHTGINFSIPHMVISEVTGNFKDFDMQVIAEKADFTDLAVTADIKVASINTEEPKRDAHLKSDDFFNAEKFPDIKFKSTSVEKLDAKNYKINGELTIRDVTKKVTFNAVFAGTVKSPWGQTVAVWKASTSINRFDYNLKWSKAIETGGLVAGDVVTINLNIELTK
jgi:polyisoprenoid-binding protein YceI